MKRLFPAILPILALAVASCGGGDVGDNSVPVIDAQPASVSAVSGGAVTLSVTAHGNGLTYQWQLSTDLGTTWVDIGGATSAQYTLAQLLAAYTRYEYRARITGGTTIVYTDPATLKVTCSALGTRLGGAAVYDSCLNVTLLLDADLPKSLPLGVAGIQADGSMSWPVAQRWMLALNAANYLGHNDWRLPIVRPLNGTAFQLNGIDAQGNDGELDLGYNVSAPGSKYAGSTASEMPFLFYNELGGLAAVTLQGVARTGVANVNAPLKNLPTGTSVNFWSGTAYGSSGAYAFDFVRGTQYAFAATDPGGWTFHVLVLRTGDSQ